MNIKVQKIFPELQKKDDKFLEEISNRIKDLYLSVGDTACKSPEGFMALVQDSATQDHIVASVKEKIKSKLPSTVFVVGIGGANLATKALYDAVIGYGDSVRDGERKMVFLDTLDGSVSEQVLVRIQSIESTEDFFVVVVSKSGQTTETLANAEFLLSHLENKFGSIIERIAIVSSEDSPLTLEAKEKGISLFVTPNNLSDRFSAFSATTLVPLAFFGFLFEDYIRGAKEYRDNFFKNNGGDVMKIVQSLLVASTSDKNIYDLFIFAPRLETLGKWYRQLFAESLGKEKGDHRYKAMTPIVSIGTTDLHSLHQLVIGGPKDKFTHFISVGDGDSERVGDAASLDIDTNGIVNKKIGEISSMLLASVEATYESHDLPYVHTQFENISFATIGEYMMRSMLEVVLLAHVWGVNAFDQPSVEEYKNTAKQLLNE
jgi:glucose-6-phosphate isomerase